MKLYVDERGYQITEDDLRASYAELKTSGDTEAETYNDYVRNCTDQNGTLREV